ncbi:hypothetical protein [Methanobrevibacter sp.]
MSITSPISKETRMMNLRSQIKGLTHQRSVLANRIAETLDITGNFLIEDLALDDPRIPVNLVEKFNTIQEKIEEKIFELDNLKNPDTAEASRKVFKLINKMSLEESIEVLRKYDCKSTLELVDKVSENPGLLDKEGVL